MKLKIFYGIFIGLILFSACSKDDDSNNNNTDIIIGKWRAIEKFESNMPVSLPVCSSHIYTEYKANNMIDGGKIISNDFPDECSNIEFAFGFNWKNLGDSKYRIRQNEEQGQIFTFYKEGANLVSEDPDGITKIVFEPYQ